MPFPDSRPVKSAPEQITSAIRERVLDGSLSPGTRLPTEDELAQRFGVSRPTIRLAMRRLQDLGVITSERGRTGGHRISDPSQSQLVNHVDGFITVALGGHQLTYEHLLDVRRGLDLLAASSAATEADEGHRAELTSLGAQLAAPRIAQGSVEAALDLDLTVHHSLARASRNPLLLGLYSAILFAFRRSGFAASLSDPHRVLVHLDEVIDAVLVGDADGAAAAMHRHHQDSLPHPDSVVRARPPRPVPTRRSATAEQS